MISTRKSGKRDRILEFLRSVDTHPTADEIYAKLKLEIPSLSLGTVYRNLTQLVESGDILEIQSEDKTSRFDGNISQHYHFSCKKCKKVFDVFEKEPKEVEKIKAQLPHSVHGHKLSFFGVCENCLENN